MLIYVCLHYNVWAYFSVLFLSQASYIISKFNLCAFDHNNIIILKRTVCINLISCNIIDYIIYKAVYKINVYNACLYMHTMWVHNYKNRPSSLKTLYT